MSRFVVKNRQGVFVVREDDVVYMEKKLRKICLHVRCDECKSCSVWKQCNGEGLLEFYGRFKEIVPVLDDRFLFCHRSYVINMDEIVWMSGGEIYVAGNKRIYMGRDTYSKARKAFTEYINKKYPEKTLKNTNYFL